MKNLCKARVNVLLYNSTKNMNISPANRKNPNFPALKSVGCKSPMLKTKKKRGKGREIFSLDLERSPLKNDCIFMNGDWTITVTANEWERVAGSQKYPV